MIASLAVVACGDGGGGGASAAVAGKLQECHLLTDGKAMPYVADIELAECQANCNAAGTCDELTQTVCQGQPSARTRDCYAECLTVDCADGHGSYAQLQKCDGRNDCDDKSDESGCPTVAGPEYCKQSGAWIFAVQRCDGIDQCGDGSDELGCPSAPEQFACKGMAAGFSQAVPASVVCDQKPDCFDGSDEQDCPDVPGFKCKPSVAGVSRTIPLDQVCDLKNDCGDDSDESSEQGCAKLNCP